MSNWRTWMGGPAQLQNLPRHTGTAEHYQQQLRFAERRGRAMTQRVINDAKARGATVTQLHDEIIIEWPEGVTP